jgi:hypothetical protein
MATYEDFLARFDGDAVAAGAFQDWVLSAGSEFLTEEEIAVRDGEIDEPSPGYWDGMIDALEQSEALAEADGCLPVVDEGDLDTGDYRKLGTSLTETAIVGQTPATSTSWLRAFGGAFSAPLPDGSVYFARAARKDGDELTLKADRMTLAGATTYCQNLLRRGFAVAAVFAEFDDELWQDRCRMVAGPFTA